MEANAKVAAEQLEVLLGMGDDHGAHLPALNHEAHRSMQTAHALGRGDGRPRAQRAAGGVWRSWESPRTRWAMAKAALAAGTPQ